MPDAWTFVQRFPDKCVAEVSRKGISEPCDKPAVAVAWGDAEGEMHWPVCAYHTRGRKLISLTDVIIQFGAAHA